MLRSTMLSASRLSKHFVRSRTRLLRPQQELSAFTAGIHHFHATDSREATTREELGDYLQTKYNVDEKFHDGVIKALESVYGEHIGVQHLDSFGKAGIEALLASVENQLSKRQGLAKRPSIPLTVKVPHHSTEFDLEWKLGDSILELAHDNEELMLEYIEGVCGGNMSCCTCHIYIDQPEFQALLSEPEEAELDMLVSECC